MRKTWTSWDVGITIGGPYIRSLRYADDTTLFSAVIAHMVTTEQDGHHEVRTRFYHQQVQTKVMVEDRAG